MHALLLAALLAAPAYQRQKNTFILPLADGCVEIEWGSSSTYRYARRWNAGCRVDKPIAGAAVDVTVNDLGGRLEFATQYLKVSLEKAGGRVEARKLDGTLLAADASEPRREATRIVLARETVAGAKYLGLGPRPQSELDLHGKTIRAAIPFLISSAGYGVYYRGARAYTFELGEPYRVLLDGAGHVEYFFYYGPTPKEVLEQHTWAEALEGDYDAGDLRVLDPARLPKQAMRLPRPALGSWDSLRNALYEVQHASFSAVLLPAFDLSLYRGSGELSRRAAQLASVFPLVCGPPGSRAGSLRPPLLPYLLTYIDEARERGFPVVRPLAMQYPRDPETWKHSDAFLLGDELLVAPVVTPGGKRSVYLPMGVWTDLRTNAVHQGRRLIEVEAGEEELPLFARNGSIVPLAPVANGTPMMLHYFPKLGAEFFLIETTGDFSQFHAAPATDFLRLETESRLDRLYEWVVHHLDPPSRVAAGDMLYSEAKDPATLRPGWWYYDHKARNLHVQVRAQAGEDHIVNIAF